MKVGARGVLVGGVLIAIVAPWAATVLLWLGNPRLIPSDVFQLAVFTLVFSRALLYLSYPMVRKLSPGASIILFSGDILILPAAILLSVVTGGRSEVAFAISYIDSWFSASLIAYPPLVAYGIVDALRGRGRLAYVLPAAAFCFIISTLVMVAFETYAGLPGLNGIMGMAIAEAKSPAPPLGWTLEVITGCGAILFVSLAAYAVAGRREAEGMLASKVALGVAGAFGLFAWIQALPRLDPLLGFGLPTLVVVSVIWVASRGS